MADYYIGLAFDEWCDMDYAGEGHYWGGGYGPLPKGYKAPYVALAKPTDFPLITNV